MSTSDKDHHDTSNTHASDGDGACIFVNAVPEVEHTIPRPRAAARYAGPSKHAASLHADDRHTEMREPVGPCDAGERRAVPPSPSMSSSKLGKPLVSSVSSADAKPEEAERCVQSANVDEAERCVDDANLLLLGASSWPEETRLEMIHKATRLLRKAHNMSKMTIQSVPQWLTMRGASSSAHGPRSLGPRIPASTIEEAIRFYAREEARTEATPSASSHREQPYESTESDMDDQDAFLFIREIWSKIQYVVFDLTGLGRFFAPEWKSTVLIMYLLVAVLAIARYANQAPLWTLFYGTRQPAQAPRTDKSAKASPLQSGAASINREDSKWTNPSDYTHSEWFYSPLLLSWLAFVIVPFIIDHFHAT